MSRTEEAMWVPSPSMGEGQGEGDIGDKAPTYLAGRRHQLCSNPISRSFDLRTNTYGITAFSRNTGDIYADEMPNHFDSGKLCVYLDKYVILFIRGISYI